MKQTGIVDRFEGDFCLGNQRQNGQFPRRNACHVAAEGMVVIVQDGRIIGVDQIETQRIEDDMRRRRSASSANRPL